MQDAVAGLEPQVFWKRFAELSSIPRPSGKEQAARDWVVAFAEEHDLEHEVDDYGNVLVRKPGAGGLEEAPPVALQGHLDMVCQANRQTVHDFERDAIRLVRDGEWLKADGTTLGADNGVGCCMALAVLESDDLAHPPLECVFTLEEETGLCGAAALGFELEARRLLNLDTEEDGEIYVGCAGGQDTDAVLPLRRQPVPPGHAVCEVTLRGLRGGHSGCDIHEQRGNALKLLARALIAAAEGRELCLASLEGGTAHNAIPREAAALVTLPEGEDGAVEERLRRSLAAFSHELRAVESNLELLVAPAEAPAAGALAAEDGRRLLDLVMALPHGVYAHSQQVEDLVETSCNLAIVTTEDAEARLKTSQRSSSPTGIEAIRETVAACHRLAGATHEHGNSYPGWEPDLDSEILEVVRQAMQAVRGEEPGVKAIHAGLECGIIGERYPGLDMVSIGPTIRNAHSPDECLRIASVPELWEILKETLKRLG